MQTSTGADNNQNELHAAMDGLREEVAEARAVLERQRVDIRELKKEVRRLARGIEGQTPKGRTSAANRPTKTQRQTPRRKGGPSAPPAEEEGWVEPSSQGGGAGDQSAEAKRRALERKQAADRERRRATRLAKKKSGAAGPSTAARGSPATATPQKRQGGDRGGTTENWKRQRRDQYGRFISSRGESSATPAAGPAEKKKAPRKPRTGTAEEEPVAPTSRGGRTPEPAQPPAVIMLGWYDPIPTAPEEETTVAAALPTPQPPPPSTAETVQAAPANPQPQQPAIPPTDPRNQDTGSPESTGEWLQTTSSDSSVSLSPSSNSAASSRSPSP